MINRKQQFSTRSAVKMEEFVHREPDVSLKAKEKEALLQQKFMDEVSHF